jgi:outer membrane protein OmpA-like peptidoglycan-associated protein
MKKKNAFSSLALGLAAFPLAATTNAHADQGWYAGAEGGINWLNSEDFNYQKQPVFNAHYSDGYLLGLTTGYAMRNGLRPELALDYRRNSIDSISVGTLSTNDLGGRMEAYTLMSNLWYDFKSGEGLLKTVHPYLGGGIGPARLGLRGLNLPPLGPVNNYQTAFAYQLGAGVGFELAPNFTASVDYRFIQTNRANFEAFGTADDARYRAHTAMLGLRYSFGAPAAEPVAQPAPAPQPQVAPAPTPAPVVTPEVAPVDSDGDGVPDNLDKCPNTPKGFKVDANGCIVEQTLILQSVNFVTNSDQLTPEAKQRLDEIIPGLLGQPDLHIEIDGHTDSRGAKAYNLKLSERRAASVRAYLVSKGVNAANLVARGFGDQQPIASNKTADGQAKNRRVEFKIVSQLPPNVKVEKKGAAQ